MWDTGSNTAGGWLKMLIVRANCTEKYGITMEPRRSKVCMGFLAMSPHGSVTVLTAPPNSHFWVASCRIRVKLKRVGRASPHSMDTKLIHIHIAHVYKQALHSGLQACLGGGS